MIPIKLMTALCVFILSIAMIVSVPSPKGKLIKNVKSSGKTPSVSSGEKPNSGLSALLHRLRLKCAKWSKNGICLEVEQDDEAQIAMDIDASKSMKKYGKLKPTKKIDFNKWKNYIFKCLKYIELEYGLGRECARFVWVRRKDGNIKNDDDMAQSDLHDSPPSDDFQGIKELLTIFSKRGRAMCVRYNKDRSKCLKFEVLFPQDSPKSDDAEGSRDNDKSRDDLESDENYVGGNEEKEDDVDNDDDGDDNNDDDNDDEDEQEQIVEEHQNDIRSQRKRPARKRKGQTKLKCIKWDKKGRCVRFEVPGMWNGK